MSSIDFSLLFLSSHSLSLFLLFISLPLLYILFRLIDSLLLTPYRFVEHFRTQGLKAPKFAPLLGEFPELLKAFKEKRLIEYSEEMQEQYGRVRPCLIGPLTSLACNEPDLLKLIFTTHAHYYVKGSDDQKAVFRPLFRNGLLLSEGDHWTRQRKLIAPAFHFINLKEMVPLMASAADECVNRWLSKLSSSISASASSSTSTASSSSTTSSSPSITIDLSAELETLSLSVLATACFGSFFSSPSSSSSSSSPSLSASASSRFLAANHTFHLTRHHRSASLIGLLPLLKDVSWLAGREKMLRAAQDMNEIAKQVVLARSRGESRAVAGRTDLLDLLLAAKTKDGQKMTLDEVCEETLTFLTAGENAMAVTVVWCIYYLLTTEGLMDRACQEIAAVCSTEPSTTPDAETTTSSSSSSAASPSSASASSSTPSFQTRAPSAESIRNLVFLEALIYESMRLHPPLPIITKLATKTHKLGDIIVPEGTTVNINVLNVHRLRDVWGADACSFNPDRFLSADDEGEVDGIDGGAVNTGGGVRGGRHPFAFLGFSAGPRKCIGKNFAMFNMKIVLVALLQNFVLQLAPGQDLEVDVMTNLPKHGMQINVMKRTMSLQQEYGTNERTENRIFKPLGMI